MDYIIKTINTLLNEIHDNNVHNLFNYDDKVRYPYITFETQDEHYSPNQYVVRLQLNLFDHGHSFAKIEQLKAKLIRQLNNKRLVTDEAFFYFDYDTSVNVPTGDRNIKRIDMTFSITVYDRLAEGAVSGYVD